MKKVWIQSPLDRLPLHVKQSLVAMLTTGGRDGHGINYAQACQRLKTEFGVQTSKAALCGFYHRHRPVQTGVIEAEVTPAADNTFTITVRVRLVQNPRTDECHLSLHPEQKPRNNHKR